jgi:hypothetical protein
VDTRAALPSEAAINVISRRLVPGLVLLTLFFGGVAGCAPASTPLVDLVTPTLAAVPSPSPAAPVEATLPAGWESYESQAQCGYAIDHPSEMQGVSQGTHSWILSPTTGEPSGAVPNFVYVSVIPDGFQGEVGEVYNYDPVAVETLLNLEVGEGKSMHDNPNVAQGFTYTRLPDRTLSNQSVQMYENTQPWEFPAGTKEIRYLLQANGCTYLIGGYIDTTGSDQPGAMNEDRFNQIINTFRLKP